VVLEHRVVEGQLGELADLGEGRLRLEDQVLVADLEVVLEPGGVAARLRHLLLPASGHCGDGEVLDGAVQNRERDIAAVADHVDEAGLGEHPLDRPHPAHVARGLVAVSRFLLELGVELEEGADRGGRVERVEPHEAVTQGLLVEAEVPPLPVRSDHLDEGLDRGTLALFDLDQVGDEVGLGRHRQLRVRVEHHPQERRP
jgi:hypothetical protein